MDIDYIVYLIPGGLIPSEIARWLFGDKGAILGLWGGIIIYSIIYFIVKRRYAKKLTEIESMIDWV